MKSVQSVLILIAGAALVMPANSQEALPIAPSPQVVVKEPVFHASDYIGIAALAGLHVGDIVTTYQGQHLPCGCEHEGNPLSPLSRNLGALIAYQAAWVGANTFVTYKLEKHHHRTIAWELRIAQAGVEAWATQHNARLNSQLRNVKVPIQ